ncbi:PREDICTED: protein phosphatase 1 regulatory subunit 42-like [Polistes canadensis]|uniref:protein phosphatase 1 regulatory subunit 42-like n=1 Tax=Polistes canadensis TaxID=91411 RepID=UPI000718C7AE|nr:PREDICTED: protein phosphatase 1 regulatory subunit 42-like [Polistes canadensis]
MVKLTSKFIEKKYVQIRSKSLSKANKKQELWKLTHLYMNGMFINEIGNFAVCKNLKVIYLQDNNISRIENLHFATHLTHLYMQHNKISKLENLDCLQKLRKLYVGYNCISVIEGLENIENLIELHAENQSLTLGETLCLEPRSAITLSKCLKKLNISNNKMTTLTDIANFSELEILEAKNNLLEDIEDLTQIISTLISLKELYMNGNPVVHKHRYKESLIANSNTLANLDGKNISDTCRRFLQVFKEKRFKESIKKITVPITDDIANSLNLPPAFKKSVYRAIFQQPGPKLSIKVTSAMGELQPHSFPLWKTAAGINSLKDNHITPRPFWRNKTNKKEICKVNAINNKAIMFPPI